MSPTGIHHAGIMKTGIAITYTMHTRSPLAPSPQGVRQRRSPLGLSARAAQPERLGTDDAITLWNASTGKAYEGNDLNCPLNAIYVVASSEQIWGNKQSFDEPRRLSW